MWRCHDTAGRCIAVRRRTLPGSEMEYKTATNRHMRRDPIHYLSPPWRHRKPPGGQMRPNTSPQIIGSRCRRKSASCTSLDRRLPQRRSFRFEPPPAMSEMIAKVCAQMERQAGSRRRSGAATVYRGCPVSIRRAIYAAAAFRFSPVDHGLGWQSPVPFVADGRSPSKTARCRYC
jgi:hypothetical protein